MTPLERRIRFALRLRLIECDYMTGRFSIATLIALVFKAGQEYEQDRRESNDSISESLDRRTS